MTTLEDFGWNDFFADALSELGRHDVIPARVTRQDRGRYLVEAGEGAMEALLPGKLLDSTAPADLPAVGDWVALEARSAGDIGIVHSVLPRKSKFSRKTAWRSHDEQIVAANIDTLFLVMALEEDFNLRRLERYLTLVSGSGADAVIVLNKADLCDDAAGMAAETESVAGTCPIVTLTALDARECERLRPWIGPGRTVAFLGSSGVGKSTLTNGLYGEAYMATTPTSLYDGTGQHTTTHRELILLSEGGMIIDTPGMREVQLWGDVDQVSGAFADIEELARSCRFRDCKHNREPGCAVQKAIGRGDLDAARLKSYRKLGRELAREAAREDTTVLKRESRARGRKMSKYHRARAKAERRYE